MGTVINTTLALFLGGVAGVHADVYDDVYAQMDRAPALAVNTSTIATPLSVRTNTSTATVLPPGSPTFAPPHLQEGIQSFSHSGHERSVNVGSVNERPFDEPLGQSGIRAHILYAAKHSSLPPALIHAVIATESNFNPNARSRVGALGLMQLMPRTAHMLGVDNPFDPRQNVLGGSRYLRQLLDQFSGDLELALAAYNAGPATVLRYGGVPPYAETTRYVSRVRDRYRAASALYLGWKKMAQ